MDTQALDYPINALCADDHGSDLDRTPPAGRADTARAYPVGGVLGSYRLLQQIGAGGMGRVFVAEHVRLGRRVALKVLRSEFSGNLEAVKRFFDEARSVNCISHENIIEVSDFVESPRGPSFYIMELLHGEDLRTLQERSGILSFERVLRIGMQVCSGLGAAHDAGIIHRDLKPDNIFLIERNGQRDFVKLLDFGVAKLMNATVDEASTFRSTAGMVVGTPDYMAPEQALGHAVNHLADVYATGVILYEMVAGRRPFVASSAREVMVQHLTAPPTRPSLLNPAAQIPTALEDLILACLGKEPNERPQSIKEVERRLGEILKTLPAERRRASDQGRASRRHRPLKVAGVAALLLATIAGAVWIGSGSLLASMAPIARADAKPGVPGAIHSLGETARPSLPTFTIDPAGLPQAASTPPTVAAAPPAVAEPVAPTERIARKTAGAPPPTEAPHSNERRHPKLDRNGVLDPFE